MARRSEDSRWTSARMQDRETSLLRTGEHWPPHWPARPRDAAAAREREHILGNLREAGLGEDQALAEAERLLGGDVWSG